MTVRLTDWSGTVYLLSDPEPLDSALLGPCLRARYRLEGQLWDYDVGVFRLDTAREVVRL